MVKASCRNQRKQSTCFPFFCLTRLWICHMIIFFNLTHSLRIFTVHTGALETHCLSSPSRSRQLLEVRVWVRRWVQCEERPNKEGIEMLKGTKWRHRRAEWTFSCFLAVNSPSLARQWRFPVRLFFCNSEEAWDSYSPVEIWYALLLRTSWRQLSACLENTGTKRRGRDRRDQRREKGRVLQREEGREGGSDVR